MSHDVGANREDDEKWILIDEKMCRTCKKWNIPKILYCGHVIWICEKCLSEKFEENSDQICCPECQGPLVDPLLNGNGGGKILQENLFADLFQEEEYWNSIILHENNIRCSLCHPKNIRSVSFCRLCKAMLCKNCSDEHSPYHLLQYRESIKTCCDKRTSTLCCIHGTDSFHFCSTHSVPICPLCNDNFHKECSVKDILKEREERMLTLTSIHTILRETKETFTTKQKDAVERLKKDKERINVEFEKLVKSIRKRQEELEKCLEEKYKDKEQVFNRKLRRVIKHESLVKHAMTSAPTPAFFDMTHTLHVICDNVVSDTSMPDDVMLDLRQDDISKVRATIKRLGIVIEKDILHFDDITYFGNIKLSENNKRAQIYQNCEDGIILSSQPMEYDKLYQVSVLACGDNQQGSMLIGVCWKDAQQALQSTAVIGQNGVWVEGVKVEKSEAYGKKMGDVGKGSIVGIAIRSVDCRLHLFIDGKDCGPSPVIFHKEPNNPPFALFFVKGKIKEIQALPLKKVSTYSPTLPCGITKCKTCEQINSACSISGPRGGLNLTSTGFNCDSKNVVYVVTCNKCNMLYVGQTGGTIRKRCNSHRTNIKSSVCQHKSICGSEFSIAGIFKVKQDEQDEDEQDEQDEDEQDEQDEDEQDEDKQDEQDEDEQDEHEQDGQNEQDEQKLKNKNQRKAMETILILKLGTRQPSGLNKNISVKKK